MHDFSRKYRGVSHFGLWAEESADTLGNRDAWAILCDAARRCSAEDMRKEPNMLAALNWFKRRLVRQQSIEVFHKALDVHDPVQRHFAACDALDLLARHAGLDL